MGWKEGLQVTLFILAWIPVGFLAGTTVFGVAPTYNQDFSIYNEEWNGLSQYRTQIEDNGFTALAIQSTMSVITRYNGSAVLFIIGPVRDFTIDATLTIFQHMEAGGSVVIADDFGTANNSLAILNNLILAQLATMGVQGLLSFADGILLDLDSYDISPKLPVIRNFLDHELTEGVTELHLNNATAINPYCALGLAGIARTTNRAWLERNITDPTPSPSPGELNGSLPVVGAFDLGLLGFEGGGRLVAISDPSIFINTMYQEFAGNRRFGDNLVNWLTHGDPEIPIVFCEQLLAQPILSGEFFYGAYLGRVLWATTNILLAPIYPLMTTVGIRKYLPEMKKPTVKGVSEVFLRRGQTYFGERMTYYRTEGNYARVVKMLYRRLRRGLRKKYQWTQYDSKKTWDLIRHKDSKMREADFHKIIKRIEEISSKPSMKLKESEMMSLFFFMKNLQDKLIESK